MSRTRPTDREAAILRLSCDRCDRGPGLWCVAVRHWWGEPYGPDEVAPWAASLHQVRRQVIDDVWRAGYLEGVVEGLDEAIAECKRPNRWTVTLERIQQNRAGWAKWLTEDQT